MNDLFQKMLFDQYDYVEVYDVKVTLTDPLRENDAARELLAYPGSKNVEALAEIPITIRHQWFKEDTVLLGIPWDGRLYNIVDDQYNRIPPPESGLFLSEHLAELLDAEVGKCAEN